MRGPTDPLIRTCIHFKVDGKKCGSPAMTGKAHCYHHDKIVRQRNMRKLPFLKNAADIQQAVMDLMQAMMERRIAFREGTALLYGLQLTQTNLKTSGFELGLQDFDKKGSFIHHVLEGISQQEVEETEAFYELDEEQRKEREEALKALHIRQPEMPKRAVGES